MLSFSPPGLLALSSGEALPPQPLTPFYVGREPFPLRLSFRRVAWAEISQNEPFCRLGSPGGAPRRQGAQRVTF